MDIGGRTKLPPSSSFAAGNNRREEIAAMPAPQMHMGSPEGVRSTKPYTSLHGVIPYDESNPNDLHVPDLEALLPSHDLADFVLSPTKVRRVE